MMFKNKFKGMVDTQKLDTTDFDVIKAEQASFITGGGTNCKVLTSCGTFTGTCINLSSCNIFSEEECFID